MKIKKRTLGIIVCFVAVICSSTYAIFAKLLLGTISSETLTFLAQLFSVIGVLMFCGLIPEMKKLKRLSRRKIFWLFVVSALSAVVAPLLLMEGLRSTTATNAVLIGRVEPVLTSLLSMWWLKEKVSSNQILGAVLLFSGIILIVTQNFAQSLGYDVGSLYVIGSAAVWSLGNVFFKRSLSKISPDLIVLFRNITGMLILFVMGILLGRVGHDFTPLNDDRTFWYVVGFVFFSIFLAQLLWYRALEIVPTVTASSISLSSPFFGIAFAILLLGEHLQFHHFTGGLFVIIGLGFILSHRHKHSKSYPLLQQVRHWGGHS